MACKEALLLRGAWSQYLEVGIGPDPEIFTKCQPMSSVGFGADVGLHPGSRWNNPEPEVAMVCDASGRMSATLCRNGAKSGLASGRFVAYELGRLIGPSADSMRKMGSKTEARKTVSADDRSHTASGDVDDLDAIQTRIEALDGWTWENRVDEALQRLHLDPAAVIDNPALDWTPETGAHAIYGAIRDAWIAQGWEQGELGYPTSDERPDGRVDGRGAGDVQGGGVKPRRSLGGHLRIVPRTSRPFQSTSTAPLAGCEDSQTRTIPLTGALPTSAEYNSSNSSLPSSSPSAPPSANATAPSATCSPSAAHADRLRRASRRRRRTSGRRWRTRMRASKPSRSKRSGRSRISPG